VESVVAVTSLAESSTGGAGAAIFFGFLADAFLLFLVFLALELDLELDFFPFLDFPFLDPFLPFLELLLLFLEPFLPFLEPFLLLEPFLPFLEPFLLLEPFFPCFEEDLLDFLAFPPFFAFFP